MIYDVLSLKGNAAVKLRTFRARLLLASILTVAIAYSLVSTASLYSNFVRLNSALDENGRLFAEQTSAALTRSVLDEDLAAVRAILAKLVEEPDVDRAAFVPREGGVGQEMTSGDPADPSYLLLYSAPITIQEGSTSEILGVLDVMVTSSGLWQELKRLALFEIGKLLALLCFAYLLFFFVLARFSSPLEGLENAVHAIEQNDLHAKIPFLTRKDEIGALGRALEGLRLHELKRAERRHTNSQNAIREGTRLQHALHSTRDVAIVIDETNKIVFSNASAKTFFPGFPVGDTLFNHAGKMQPGAELVRAALSERSQLDIEISVMLHGVTRYFQARTGPIVDKQNNDLGGLFVASDITEKFEHSKEAAYFASHDPLTGLFNRRQMEITFADWCQARTQVFGILLIDLDYFKEINDTMGHIVGDSVLKALAQMFVKYCNSEDVVVRLGGDEFAIISRRPNCARNLELLASTLIAALQIPLIVEGREVALSISAGVAVSETLEVGWRLEDLMHLADLALYEAKKCGRGQYKNFISVPRS